MKEKKFNYIVTSDSRYYIATHDDTNISSFGATYEEAVDNLKEALELYFEVSGE